MFDGKFLGYVAIGQTILFRPAAGPDVHVCTAPQDIDPHVLAQSLNDAANCVLRLAGDVSQFKF